MEWICKCGEKCGDAKKVLAHLKKAHKNIDVQDYMDNYLTPIISDEIK